MTTSEETSASTTPQHQTATKRVLTDKEKRELLARRRKEKILQRGDAFLKNPETALQNQSHTTTTTSPTVPPVVHNETTTAVNDQEPEVTTPRKEESSSKNNNTSTQSPSTQDPFTPQTPQTPIVEKSGLAGEEGRLKQVTQSPYSPNFSPIFNALKSEANRHIESPLVKETKKLIPDVELVTDTESTVKPKSEDYVTKWMIYVRYILIVVFATYSALHSCFVPCDSISRSYLGYEGEGNDCAQRIHSIWQYDWKQFNVNYLSTWPYIPPLILFLTIQSVVLVPRVLRFVTVKRNKNNKTWLDVVLVGLQIYVRLKRLVREACLFIFIYVMVVSSTKVFVTAILKQ